MNGSTISVDFSRLRALAEQMRSLVQHVSNRAAIAQPDLDSDLFGKLASVENDWSTHRRQLQSFLSDTAAAVEQIVAEYEKTNDLVARAASAR